MLKREVITANAALAGLTDEQIAAIEALSQNDENAVISARIGETYREWDRRIEEATGVKRNGDEKSYDYLTRAAKDLSGYKTKAEEMKTELAAVKSEKERLAEQIKTGGGSTELNERYTALEAKHNTLKDDYSQLRKGFGELEAKHAKDLFDVRLGNDITLAASGVKWKEGYTPTITTVLDREIRAALNGGKYKPEYGDDGTGTTRLLFRNEAGEIMRNAENALQPFTAAELYAKEAKAMGAVAEERQQNGGGSTPPAGGAAVVGGKLTVDISGARTRAEADTAIRSALAAQGIPKGTPEYTQALDAAWEDNKVAELPNE